MGVRSVNAVLEGELGTLLAWVSQKANTPAAGPAGVSLSVVAGACNHFKLLFQGVA